MKLSILDQAPISAFKSAKEALYQSMKLSQAGEKLGYTRFWIAEHHDLPGLACPAPEVMLGFIGAHTNNIRIGSGAVLLPHYKPYKVAEIFNMLSTLFPGRIDMGIGRAPGGSAEATEALSENFLQQVWNMPNSLKELLHFVYRDFPDDHKFSSLNAAPIPDIPPVPWLLGTSKKSAILAGELGVSYTFGQFMSDKDGKEIIQQYLNSFKARSVGDKAEVIVTVSAYCAETTDRAEEIALSSLIWRLLKDQDMKAGVPTVEEAKRYPLNEKEKDQIKKMKENMIIGNPAEVKAKLLDIKENYYADEIMIVTITHSPEDKIRSYELIADQFIR